MVKRAENTIRDSHHSASCRLRRIYSCRFYSKWSHLSRIVPNLSSQFQPLENILRTVFIPTMTGRPPPNDTDRDVFALPTFGGLGLSSPAKQCDLQFSASHFISNPLIESTLYKTLSTRSSDWMPRCQPNLSSNSSVG